MSLFPPPPSPPEPHSNTNAIVIAQSINDSATSCGLSDGPLEEISTRCNVITAASLIASCKGKNRYDGTHSHGLCGSTQEGRWTSCALMLLDRNPSEAVMLDLTGKKWAGANGDWIATVGRAWNWQLVHVYTCHPVPLLLIPGLQATSDVLECMAVNSQPVCLLKIVICRVPTTSGMYRDFSVIALFDMVVPVLEGAHSRWTVLDNQFSVFNYRDAIMHKGIVFAVTHIGTVYAWDHLKWGPMLLPHAPDYRDDDDCGPSIWWLSRTPDGEKLLLVETRGVSVGWGSRFSYGSDTDDAIYAYHYCRTTMTCSTGFSYHVYSMDTSVLLPAKPWQRVADMGAFSLFLGLNYPIAVLVALAKEELDHRLARRNSVYTLYNAIDHEYKRCPDVCRFSLNGECAAVGFGIYMRAPRTQTPLWFVPSFAKALEWNGKKDQSLNDLD